MKQVVFAAAGPSLLLIQKVQKPADLWCLAFGSTQPSRFAIEELGGAGYPCGKCLAFFSPSVKILLIA